MNDQHVNQEMKSSLANFDFSKFSDEQIVEKYESILQMREKQRKDLQEELEKVAELYETVSF